MTKTLIQAIEESGKIGITGHIRPDGDCVGSTVALYNYIRKNYPDKSVSFFLETVPDEMSKVLNAPDPLNGDECDETFDLFVSLDSSSLDRLGPNVHLFEKAGIKYVVDHHKTNTCFGDYNHVVEDASSCCEVLFDLLEYEKMDLSVAMALYLGIVHDTGVFKYSSTCRHTMEIAGMLLDLGVDSARIIDGTFYEKSWAQNKLLAIALNKAMLYDEGYVAATLITRQDLKSVGLSMNDTDGIVEQLRLTRGVEIAIFVREDGDDYYKFSLRSKNGEVDVSKIAVYYEGGGHSRAAGFNVSGNIDEIIENVLRLIKQYKNKA